MTGMTLGFQSPNRPPTSGTSHMNHHTANSISNQQRIIQKHRTGTDCFSALNLLTSDVLFEGLENRLPEHRERLFPPTETLAMFVAQAIRLLMLCLLRTIFPWLMHVISMEDINKR